MFEFSTKAKQLAIGLTLVGAILWIVGFAMNGSSSHEADHGHDAHATEMHADEGHDAHSEEAHDAHAEHENDYPGEAHAAMIQSTYESDHADAQEEAQGRRPQADVEAVGCGHRGGRRGGRQDGRRGGEQGLLRRYDSECTS